MNLVKPCSTVKRLDLLLSAGAVSQPRQLLAFTVAALDMDMRRNVAGSTYTNPAFKPAAMDIRTTYDPAQRV